jgi:hypothetical protein
MTLNTPKEARSFRKEQNFLNKRVFPKKNSFYGFTVATIAEAFAGPT